MSIYPCDENQFSSDYFPRLFESPVAEEDRACEDQNTRPVLIFSHGYSMGPGFYVTA